MTTPREQQLLEWGEQLAEVLREHSCGLCAAVPAWAEWWPDRFDSRIRYSTMRCDEHHDPSVRSVSLTPPAPHEDSADSATSDQLLSWAWTIIAKAGEGDWERKALEWQRAARKWADAYHKNLVAPPADKPQAIDDDRFDEVLFPSDVQVYGASLPAPDDGGPRYRVHHADVPLPVEYPWHIRDHWLKPSRYVEGYRFVRREDAERACAEMNGVTPPAETAP